MAKETIVFNYQPEIALKMIDRIVEEINKDTEAKEEQKKVYADIKTLAHVGFNSLSPEPITDPAAPGEKIKS